MAFAKGGKGHARELAADGHSFVDKFLRGFIWFIMKNMTDIGIAWIILAVLAGVDLAGLALTGMDVELFSVIYVAGAVGVLLLVSRVYTDFRNDARLAGLALTGAQLLVFSALAGVLSYILTANAGSLIDHRLIQFDRFIGFDWPRMHAWAKNNLFEHLVLIFAYYSLVPQLVLVQTVLYALGKHARARELFWLFGSTGLSCVLISAVFPTAGAFIAFGVDLGNPYVRDFLALREGALKVIDLFKVQGVVQFPSFHLAMAIILAYAVRGVRVLFPLLLIVNALVIIATPLVGGHHLADLAGGVVVTCVAIALVRTRSAQRLLVGR